MKKTIISVLTGALSLAAADAALAADKLTLQLKWVTQAQFAGYYVAKDKGFYEDEASTSRSSPAGRTSRPSR
jgi:NitT/TauT family transport system substrate-binding protein